LEPIVLKGPVLISTDSGLINRRLAPIPELLESLIDQGIRARQRRVFTIDHPGQNLAALSVVDITIDRAVQAISIYGIEAIPLLDHRISQSLNDEREAAVFLRIAFAVQTHEPGLFYLVEKHITDHTRAVHEAMRFFPVPARKLQDSSHHITSLFERAKLRDGLTSLALTLAGERDIKELREAIESMTEVSHLAADAHYALACMGFAGKASANFVQDCLRNDDPKQIETGLRICAVNPHLANSHGLKHAIDIAPDLADVAWAILACHFPRQTFDYAINSESVDLGLKIRLAALTGYADGVVAVCLSLAEREGGITPAEADLLQLVLGEVPIEARREPNDQAAKSRALRQRLLQVLQQAQVAISDDAEHCPWKLDLILADREQAASIRLRDGKRMPTQQPSFNAKIVRLTHGLRQWLYIEHAILGQHPLALSAFDVSRRQEATMMIAEIADEMRAN
jgi:hypothetical protein